MASSETAGSRLSDAPRASGRPITADQVALLRSRLAFPREVFDDLVEPLILGFAEGMSSARRDDAGTNHRGVDPLGRSMQSALRALALRRDRILPPNALPERVGDLAHPWTYAVLLAALLRDGQAPGSDAPARQYDGVVPELGRIWLGEDPEVSLALTDVLAGRAGADNPIAALLGEVVSGRSGLAGFRVMTRGHPHAPAIDPTAASVTVPVQAVSPSGALATRASQASLSALPLPELFGWLRDGLAGGSIEINTRTALVHHVPEGLLLVSPGIFRSFLAWQGADANSQEALKRLQRSVLKVGWHLAGPGGASLLGYAWIKNGAITSRLHGIVIEEPKRLLDPLPSINPRIVRVEVAVSAKP
jgi:hypothetical protein